MHTARSTSRRQPIRHRLGAALTVVAVAGAGLVATSPAAEATAASVRTQAYGLTTTNKLVQFNTARPERARVVGTIRGANQRLVGIDFRPSNGRLYAVGRDGGVFVISKKNARANRVGRLSVPLSGRAFDIDVNPAVDALRIVSNTGQNLRYSFAENTTTVDGVLNTPNTDGSRGPRVRGISAVAYSNNDTSDRTGTTLFDINAVDMTLSTQTPANAGTINLQGPLGGATMLNAGFDIYSPLGALGRTRNNVGFATLGGGPAGFRLHEVNLLTGKARPINRFPQPVSDIAIVPENRPGTRR